MFRNYLVVAWRNMRRQRLYALINIFGLAIGIVSTLLIAMFVRYEQSYESFMEGIPQIYRVVQRQPGNIRLGSDQFAATPVPWARALKAEIPEVEAATCFDDVSVLLSVGQDHVYESGLLADDHFFQVFGYAVEQGNPEGILAEPGSIALSRRLAERLFGAEDAIGRVLEYRTPFEEPRQYKVSGIFADVPKNSHLQFEYVASILGDQRYLRHRDHWFNSSWYTYFRIHEGQRIETVESKIAAIAKQHYGDQREFFVQPASSIHLRSHLNDELSSNGDIRFVYLLIAIGTVILLLACANYVNLAIATSVQRAKEVGVRKAVGAVQRQIVAQFLSQSLLTTTIAVVLSLLIVEQILPHFELFVDRDLSFPAEGVVGIAVMAGVIIVTVGLIGGLYPSFVAARMEPAKTLKSPKGDLGVGSGIRRILVTLQFAVSIALIAATIAIYRQLQYVQSKEIGYSRNHIVTVQVLDRGLYERFSELERSLKEYPNVIAVSTSRFDPTNIASLTFLGDWTGHEGEDVLPIYMNPIGYDFLDLYEIPLVRGRGFGRDFPSDEAQHALIINETAFKALGWQDLEGKHVVRGDNIPPVNYPVIGVVRDFHMHSLRLEVAPLMMPLELSPMPIRDRISIRIAATGIQETVQFIEHTLQGVSAYPVQVQFVDGVFNQLYESDQKLGEVVALFTVVALFIGSLGLFGLVSYSVERRTKEIGIRKVLGASIPSIVALLSKEFTYLVLAANLIAWPVAYYAMNQWLQNFAYRIELGPEIFVLGGVLTLVIAWLTVSYQAIRAARANPVEALRYE